MPAKRVALATRVSPLPGISRSVGNKNSSESYDGPDAMAYICNPSTVLPVQGYHGPGAMAHICNLSTLGSQGGKIIDRDLSHVVQAGPQLPSSSDSPTSASRSAGITRSSGTHQKFQLLERLKQEDHFSPGFEAIQQTTHSISYAFVPGTANECTCSGGSRSFAKEMRALKMRSTVA
ncbi:hypothetical protein AAY473_017234 [Plecturocebus cupreus]